MTKDLSPAKSIELFQRAQAVIPGGVNSPVRAFRAVGGQPLFIRSAQGALITDVDGRTFIDYVGSWGPMILGHAHPEVIEALHRALEQGTSYGAPTEREVEMAEEIRQALPSIEKVRMTSSGTEATMSAIRLARGVTGRKKLVKFEGCYHGHSDALLVKAGSGVATLGLPDSPGVLPELADHTLTLPFNDEKSLDAVFDAHASDIASVIIEPIVGNMGVVLPKPGFLPKVRALTERHGALLIFDEVITGFRAGYHGAQGLFDIRPELTCLGKIIGGGLPVGAFGGREDIMNLLAPQGPVYQAGTLSGNPLAMTAGLTTLRILKRDKETIYPRLEKLTARLAEGIAAAAGEAGIEVRINRAGSTMTTFFTSEDVTDWASASTANRDLFGKFFQAMLTRGVYLPPSQFEAMFVSAAHTDDLIDRTIDATTEAFRGLKS
jgi:glutamate-1-semialdehyde 2,1-aminomutase